MIRSLEESQVITIRSQRWSGFCYRQIAECALLTWRKKIPVPTLHKICSGELYADCGGPLLTPAQTKRLTRFRREIASEGRKKRAA
jgi:hypothetical protein